jgi:hypothetical protein
MLRGLGNDPFLDLRWPTLLRLPPGLKIRGDYEISSKSKTPTDIIYRRKKGFSTWWEHGSVLSAPAARRQIPLRKSWRIGRELRTSASISGANSATASGWQDLGFQM